MTEMFPVVLNLKEKNVLVFGGGKVAERRIAKLLKAHARVTAVSREFTEKLAKLEGENLKLVKKEVEGGREYIEDSDLVLIATDNHELNDRLEGEARRLGKLVNRADKAGDLIIPASLSIGDVVISISTKGKSPAVTRAIKRRIEKALVQEDLLLIELQEFVRKNLKLKIADQDKRKEILRELINRKDIIDALKDGDLKKAKKIAEGMTDAYS